ncbi:hypothetical protein DEAC_c00190 [Desulfosporosinus acididurans]|uniref:Uncharacterized protein n=1 Tax=Desulfosporosinus acididurans TaxID=476652 RepID=A0A0J1FW22_9FIRM|nr:hypothetical protein DEAC_c00190 [Desulfosporosinus acididurans]
MNKWMIQTTIYAGLCLMRDAYAFCNATASFGFLKKALEIHKKFTTHS